MESIGGWIFVVLVLANSLWIIFKPASYLTAFCRAVSSLLSKVLGPSSQTEFYFRRIEADRDLNSWVFKLLEMGAFIGIFIVGLIAAQWTALLD